MISDVVLSGPLPQEVRDDIITYTGCLGGAIPQDEHLQRMHGAGFEKVEIVRKTPYDPGSSAEISACKPGNRARVRQPAGTSEHVRQMPVHAIGQ